MSAEMGEVDASAEVGDAAAEEGVDFFGFSVAFVLELDSSPGAGEVGAAAGVAAAPPAAEGADFLFFFFLGVFV